LAVWEPVRNTQASRFTISKDFLDKTAATLKEAGVVVERLTAEQVSDSARFSADRFDAFLLQGDAFPEANIEVYRRFLDSGGILIALAAEGPFEIKIAQAPDGAWRLAPESPNFAWQTTALHEHLGLKFDWHMDMGMSGAIHEPTALLKRYLPTAQSLREPLPNRWFIPTTGRMVPLIRSTMATGPDYTPQMYVAENGKRRAIICANERWLTREMLLALARMAADLRHGRVDLGKELAVTPPSELVKLGALQTRVPQGEVNPEGATPVARWGRFDGARLESGPVLAEGQSLALPVGVVNAKVPGGIAAGASVELALPRLPDGPLFLRIRGAVDAPDAALRVALDKTLLWHEAFVFGNPTEMVNLGHRYSDVANEFDRIVFVPPGAAGKLTLSNTGKAPVFFDALQIE
jgi:uncharacterized cupredoxin-like copper-binding protein